MISRSRKQYEKGIPCAECGTKITLKKGPKSLTCMLCGAECCVGACVEKHNKKHPDAPECAECEKMKKMKLEHPNAHAGGDHGAMKNYAEYKQKLDDIYAQRKKLDAQEKQLDKDLQSLQIGCKHKSPEGLTGYEYQVRCVNCNEVIDSWL